MQSAFAYSYVPGSDLLAGWALGGGISFRRTCESARDLIATVTNMWNGTALGTFGYENDSISRRTKRIDSGSVTNDFGYNARSEVASAMMDANQFGYRYDLIGNRIAATNNAEAFSYAANALNQYTSIVDGGTVAPTYDDDGNMTGYGAWTYTWDGENRLVIATDGSVAVTNAYDFASRRAFKGTAVASRTFIYDGWNLISEIKTQSSEVSTTFHVWGLDLSQTLQSAGGVGGLLSVVRGDALYFTGYDANGNVTDYVSANGTTVAHYEFDPFGNTTAATGSMANDFAHRFSTKYWDSETGLYYYGLRYYSPEAGRWLSRDPIGERGGENLYQLVGNSAIGSLDPLGAESWSPPCENRGDVGKKCLSSTKLAMHISRAPGGMPLAEAERWLNAWNRVSNGSDLAAIADAIPVSPLAIATTGPQVALTIINNGVSSAIVSEMREILANIRAGPLRLYIEYRCKVCICNAAGAYQFQDETRKREYTCKSDDGDDFFVGIGTITPSAMQKCRRKMGDNLSLCED